VSKAERRLIGRTRRTDMRAILISALEPNTARREDPAGLVASVFKQQGDDAVCGDVVCREVAHRCPVVGVRPQILSSDELTLMRRKR
jgi:hypothetical protein